METLASLVFFLALSASTAQPSNSNDTEHCQAVSSSLNQLLRVVDENIFRYGMATQVVSGINIANPDSVNPYLCPLIDSKSLADLQTQLVDTGLLEKVAGVGYRMGIMGYGLFKQHSPDPKYMNKDQVEIKRKFDRLTTHLQDYGYMDFDVLALAVTYGCAVGVGGLGALPTPPIFPGSYVGEPDELRDMLWTDVSDLLSTVVRVAGRSWPGITHAVRLYSAGVVDLNNQASLKTLVHGIADIRSEADVGEFLASHFLGPTLKYYFPQLEGALVQVRRDFKRRELFMMNSTSVPQEAKDKFRRISQAFYDLHDGLIKSGVLSLK